MIRYMLVQNKGKNNLQQSKTNSKQHAISVKTCKQKQNA